MQSIQKCKATFPHIVFFILLSISAHAQQSDVFKGNYISHNGDSHAGQFYAGDLIDNILKYRVSEGDNWVTLTPEQVKTVTGEGDIYLTTQSVVFRNDSSLIFIRRILNGGYSLYEGDSKKFGLLYYINSRNNEQMLRVNQRAIVLQLQFYFGNCAKTATGKLKYNKENLLRYVAQMNECRYGETAVRLNNKPFKPVFALGASAGYFFQTPHSSFQGTNDFDGIPFQGEYRPVFGLTASLDIMPLLGITTGISYLNKSFSSEPVEASVFRTSVINPSTGEPFGLNTKYYYKVKYAMRLKYIEVPVGARFRFRPYSKSAPLATAGLTLSFPTVAEYENDYGTPYKFEAPSYISPLTTLEDGIVPVIYSKINIIKKPVLGAYVGLGWRKELNRNNEIAFMLQYFWSKEAVSLGLYSNPNFLTDFNIVQHRFQLSVNYYFKMGGGR